MEILLPPQSPFERWPLHHVDPRYGYVWYCGAGMVVSQLTITHATREVVDAYHGFEEQVLRECTDDLREAGGLFAIHDWRALESYDAAARTSWQERIKNRPKGYLRGSVVCVERANALLKMAVQAANVVASLTHGAKVELTTDIGPALTKHAVVAPKARVTLRPSGR